MPSSAQPSAQPSPEAPPGAPPPALVHLPGSGRTVEVIQRGAGPDLFFLHGPWGLDARALDVDAFAPSFRVHAPRFPGTGRSDGVEGIDSVFEAALHHFDVARELGLGPLVLVGHSMGGMIAAEMAAMRPRDVAALVLIAPLGLWDDARPVADFFTWAPPVAAEHLFFRSDHPDAVRMREGPAAQDTDRIDEHVEHARALSAAGRLLWPIPERGLASRLHRIEAPTLLVWGFSDRVVDCMYSDDFVSRIPGDDPFHVQQVVIGDAGHMVIRERPEVVRGEVQYFVKHHLNAASAAGARNAAGAEKDTGEALG